MPSCTIVTCAANALVRPIHDRMPVMLADDKAWEGWLDPALDGEAASELLAPLIAYSDSRTASRASLTSR